MGTYGILGPKILKGLYGCDWFRDLHEGITRVVYGSAGSSGVG